MRNIFTTLTALCCVLLITFSHQRICLAAASPLNFSGGRGTKDAPYLIANINDLAHIPYRILSAEAHDDVEYRAAHYRQTADIDIAALDEWVPIGYAVFSDSGSPEADFSFTGVYDGDGHKITGFNYQPLEKSAGSFHHYGMFGVIDGDGLETGIVKNLRLERIRLHYLNETSGIFLGGVAGRMTGGRIENCSVSGSYVASESKTPQGGGTAAAGGIVGWIQQGTVKNCVSDVTVQAVASTSFAYAGGIAGFVESGTITNCVNKRLVRAHSGLNLVGNHSAGGGIVGYTWFGRAEQCLNYGPISADASESDALGGGIFGGASSGRVLDCANEGPVDVLFGSRNSYAGGIVGRMWPDKDASTVERARNRGNVSVYDINRYSTDGLAGGIAGIMQNGVIRASLNEGRVAATAEIASAGGIAGGASSSVIEDAGNVGDVTATTRGDNLIHNEARAGGIVGTSYADYAEPVFGEKEKIVAVSRVFNMGKIRKKILTEDPQEKPGYSMIAYYQRKEEYTLLNDARWLDGISNRNDERKGGFEVPLPKNIAAISLESFARRASFDSWDFDNIWNFCEAGESVTGKAHPIPRNLPRFQ
jgi:hypothetical protein